MQTNSIKVAIHHSSGSFSDRWLEYCHEKNIAYEVVDCYQSDIISRLREYDVLLWHWHHQDTKAVLFARQFIHSLANMEIRVFPDINTCWHFDDKVGQKYLLESIGAPLVPSYVFYEKSAALDWIKGTEFPKVFKLRCGAGARNVRLVRNACEAEALCKTAFGKGYKADPGYFADASNKIRKVREKKNYFDKIKRMPSVIKNTYVKNKQRGRERGYIYFQDFIPNNECDTRVTVIGNRAFAFRRLVRQNDFRASGSGRIDNDASRINLDCVKVAFEVAGRLGSQSMAFDFVRSGDSKPLILEVSYGYVPVLLKNCAGHWDKQLRWQKGSMWPQDAIVEDIMAGLNCRTPS